MDGGELRTLRQQLRLSQSEMADALNDVLERSYDKPRVSRWENGREPIPEEVAEAVTGLVNGQPRHARILILANQKGGVGRPHLPSISRADWLVVVRGCCWSISTHKPLQLSR